MNDPGCGPEAWAILDGRLWHATTVAGLRGIRAERRIRPGTRHKGSFVGARGWVCLFDFGPSATDESNQWGNWAPWFGAARGAPVSVWLEINREAAQHELLDAEQLRSLWRETSARRWAAGLRGPWPGLIFPGVEGCFCGELPTDFVLRAVVMRADRSVLADMGPLDGLDETVLDTL